MTMWNAKACKCKKCGKKCSSIISGRAHVVVEHTRWVLSKRHTVAKPGKIPWSRARDYLEVLE